MNEKIGHYISKDKRSQISKDIKDAHFKLGFDKEKLQSVMKEEFKAQSPEKASASPQFKNQNKKTNIALSSTKTFYKQTTNSSFFSLRQNNKIDPKDSLMPSNTITISDQLKQDLRKEHFALGNDKAELKTTNMDLAAQIDNDNTVFDNEKRKNQIIKSEMRGHHFSYGEAKPIYSSMSTMQFKEHELSKVNDMKQVGQNYIKQMRQGNIIFQGDSTSDPNRFRSSSALFYKHNDEQKTPHLDHSTKDYLKKSSIVIGKAKENNFLSMNQIQQNQILVINDEQANAMANQRNSVPFRTNNFNSGLKSFTVPSTLTSSINSGMKYKPCTLGQMDFQDYKKMKTFLGSTHLTIGEKQTSIKDMQTTNKEYYSQQSVENKPVDKTNSEKLSNFLKKENFQITQNNHITQKNLANFYQSVYKVQSNGDKVKQGKPAKLADCNAQAGSITLGFHETNKQSENRERFKGVITTAEDKARSNSELQKHSSNLQKHHFELNYNQNGSIEKQFESIQGQYNKSLMQQFNRDSFTAHRGDATQLKSYLQQSHLKFGSYQGKNQMDDKKSQGGFGDAQGRRSQQQKAHSGVRTSSEVVFGTTKNDFKTNNTDFYSWIQPKLIQ